MNENLALEINNRRQKLLNMLEPDSSIIVFNKYDIDYLSMFYGQSKALIYTNSKWYIVTDSRYKTYAHNNLIETEVLITDNKLDLNCFLNTIVNKNNLVYYDNQNVNMPGFVEIYEIFGDEVLKHLDDKISKLRYVKSDYEINQIQKAEEIVSNVFEDIIKIIKPGISELDIAAEIEYLMKKKGSLKPSFDTIVASGVNSSMPHAFVSNRLIEESDIITMDFGCIYNNYCSDMTRTIFVSEPMKIYKEIYNVVLEAQKLAIDNIKPGVSCYEIDKIARDYIDSKGYGEYFSHSLGHSIGLEIHESPNFSPSSEDVLEEGMVLSVEPGIYIPNEMGVRIEDVIVVSKNGCIDLTTAPKNLYNI